MQQCCLITKRTLLYIGTGVIYMYHDFLPCLHKLLCLLDFTQKVHHAEGTWRCIRRSRCVEECFFHWWLAFISLIFCPYVFICINCVSFCWCQTSVAAGFSMMWCCIFNQTAHHFQCCRPTQCCMSVVGWSSGRVIACLNHFITISNYTC